MRALTPLRSKIRRRIDVVVHDSGRLVASSVFDTALCSRSISHNPHADEHDPSACGGQLLIVGPISIMKKVIKYSVISISAVVLYIVACEIIRRPLGNTFIIGGYIASHDVGSPLRYKWKLIDCATYPYRYSYAYLNKRQKIPNGQYHVYKRDGSSIYRLENDDIGMRFVYAKGGRGTNSGLEGELMYVEFERELYIPNSYVDEFRSVISALSAVK